MQMNLVHRVSFSNFLCISFTPSSTRVVSYNTSGSLQLCIILRRRPRNYFTYIYYMRNTRVINRRPRAGTPQFNILFNARSCCLQIIPLAIFEKQIRADETAIRVFAIDNEPTKRKQRAEVHLPVQCTSLQNLESNIPVYIYIYIYSASIPEHFVVSRCHCIYTASSWQQQASYIYFIVPKKRRGFAIYIYTDAHRQTYTRSSIATTNDVYIRRAT